MKERDDIMIQQIKEKLNLSNEVEFKLYSMIYTISKKDDRYYIISDIYDGHIHSYDTIDNLFDNYMIYGESIKMNESKINLK